MELRKRAFGIGLGAFLGIIILVMTWWTIISGAGGQKMANLSIFFRGYDVTWVGGIIGLIWGFAFGFVAGFLIAYFYNLALKSIK